jgi:serpin B
MKQLFLVFLIISIFTFSSCNHETASPDEIKTIKLDEKSAQIIEADNAFGLDFFQKVNLESEEENLMVSPLSVSLALAMTYNGANGQTKKAMEETLKLSGLSTDEINQSYQFLVDALLNVDKEVLIDIANAIFYKESFMVENDFISTNQTYYDAQVSALDFSSPDAKDIINGWVADQTNDLIKEIIDQVSGDHVMFLINAIYFKGTWKYEFDKNGTHVLDFKKSEAATIQVPMMNHEGTHLYSSNNLFQAVKLPYGNEHYYMVVLLPTDGGTVEGLINELSMSNWETWMENFSKQSKVNITIPRFKFEYEIKLNGILEDMGMGIAFKSGLADFTKINKGGNLNIDEVKHKTFVDVNETGTEAAAVTSVGMVNTSVGGSEASVINFKADRPFVFAIIEADTEAILFLGKVSNPEYDE